VSSESLIWSPRNLEVCDISVDNIHNSSGGGLQAHDYWNNTKDFVPQLAKLVSEALREHHA
jgi:hypothetical protein